ncbi:LysR substrate-binding domain-containing protein [Paraburkholderia sp. Cy-641]|uniref:LysR substrate-binding domain-containing protein n=1 Tax=Paraburkholderia sp. Cy-641 TaxID=2608337 RepID=UPI001F03D2AF|nr:LysR substrate-binding domain-containing protein [Paraburkholderia sp. Cy-641]
MKYFVSIVDSSSLSRAAERLFVAQPSLSQHMLNLEKDLSVQLLIRSPQGVVPTEAGKTLYRLARDVLRGMELIRKEVKEGMGSESGTVSIGLPRSVAAILAAPLFRHVRRTYPDIRLQIYDNVSSKNYELLTEGRVDLAILFHGTESVGISGQPLFNENFYVIGQHLRGLAVNGNECQLPLLDRIPIVAPGRTNGLRVLLEQAFDQANVGLNIVAEIESVPTLVNIAEGGDACVFFPAATLANCRLKSDTPVKKVVNPEILRCGTLCWNSSVPTQAATHAVRAIMIALVAELQDAGTWVGVDHLISHNTSDRL